MVSLTKGAKISLEKTAGKGLSKVVLGLGWDPETSGGGFLGGLFGGGGSIDLDASCLMLNANNDLVEAVYFGNKRSNNGSVYHTGDNLTGEGSGDDEQIIVDLPKIPSNVTKLVFTVNSYRGQTFEKVKAARARLLDENQQEIAIYPLSDAKGSHTGLIMVKVYNHNGEWKMEAIGQPCNGRTYQDILPAVKAVA